ncbi:MULTISPECIES: RraA family protein [unclassified Leifsonia]|uniref:RraA family protein n=1 Tax=unclassified Leifsonia TaxID=2663824 RepID=UPI0003739B91|nr:MULTISPECIES: RraA family protein [unclassified Leifsonia]TDP98736.1 regulator of RNase E activity RraA [Leifsonia sp. 115AMFTsu3.1]
MDAAAPSSAPPATAAIADAAVRLGIAVGTAPVDLVALLPGRPFAGPAAPVTHLGSVDVLLETIDDAPPGAVLVVDNGGRDDEACVGDLMLLEAATAGMSGAVIWGRHRDTAQLREIGLPVFSRGAHPFGPRRVPPAGSAMRSAFLDGVAVTPEHWIVADDDGVLVIGAADRDVLFAEAARIQSVEGAQAERMRSGASLRDQLDFARYRRMQADDPALTLRRYLAETGGAIET